MPCDLPGEEMGPAKPGLTYSLLLFLDILDLKYHVHAYELFQKGAAPPTEVANPNNHPLPR